MRPMRSEVIPGIGTMLEIEDTTGCVHNIKAVSISMFSDADPCATETWLTVGSHRIHVAFPRKDVMDEIRRAQADAKGY